MKVLSVVLLGGMLVGVLGDLSNTFLGSILNITEPKLLVAETMLKQVLEAYVPETGEVRNELCRNHSRFYKDHVANLSPWALTMVDSSSKIPSGILTGNLFELGNYDECLSVENVRTDSGLFSGQHCLVEVMLPGHTYNPRDMNPIISSVAWSVCVPSSCRAQDVEAFFRSVLPAASVHVDQSMCNTRAERKPFTPMDWCAIALLLMLSALVVSSTCYDLLCTDKGRRRELMLAFSAHRHCTALLRASKDNDSLSALYGVRFLSMVWVIIAHRYGINETKYPAINAMDKMKLADWSHLFYISAPLSVDSFLLLSGLLLCYGFLKNVDSGKAFNVAAFYLHRYIRLTPALALIILLTATLLKYVGDGPFWKANLSVVSDACIDKWWSILLYVDNYVSYNTGTTCLPQAWYLSVDMQLYCLSPLLLCLLKKSPLAGKILLGVMIAVGLLIAFLVPYINDTNISHFTLTGEYSATHARFTPWLIGIALGYVLHKSKSRQIYLRPVVVLVGWVTSTALMLAPILLSHWFYQKDYQYERFFESAYKCLSRPAWSVGLAWVIFACVKGYGGFVNTFLSCRVFLVLGRLTYSTYLVHISILGWTTVGTKAPIYWSDLTIVRELCADVMFSLAAALVLSLLVELPFPALEKLAFRPKTSKKVADTENTFDVNCDNDLKEISLEKVLFTSSTEQGMCIVRATAEQ